jgi:tRNA(Ile)-lysidine synthase
MSLDLLVAGRPVLVLVSGGRDSVCLLDLAVQRGADVRALHVHYGLGFEARAHVRELCERLAVPLSVHEAPAPRGNVQAWAREVRYGAARALTDGDVAVGHTATDQVETVLYRLAASPGRRALLGMRARHGQVIRPLLEMTREDTAAHCERRGLPYRDDPSNATRRYARNRVRHDLLGALRAIHPAAEVNVLRTLELLREEAEVLDALELPDTVAELRALPPALRRLGVQRLAGDVAVGRRADEILALGEHGTKALDVGGGRRAVVEYGRLRFDDNPPPPAPAGELDLPVPGSVGWSGGRVSADGPPPPRPLIVRAWRPGDRLGSKSLQDLFTDRKVPRERRHRLPVVTCGDRVAWVGGVATDRQFAATGVRLRWEP